MFFLYINNKNEQKTPSASLFKEVNQKIEHFSQVMQREIEIERGVFGSIKIDKRLYCDLYRKFHYVISSNLYPTVFPWVLLNIVGEVARVSFVLAIRFGLSASSCAITETKILY